MLISITQEHIDRGTCGNPGHCAVALAVTDVLKEGLFATMCGVYITIRKGPWDGGTYDGDSHPILQYIDLDCDHPLTKWMLQFDNNKEVQPASFEIPIKHEFLA